MKNIFYLGAMLLLMVSCEKEYEYPSDDYPSNVPSLDGSTGLSMWGEFIITDAKMYYRNHETGQKLVFDHFGPNKDTSSLRLGPPEFEIEVIIKDQTSFSFYKPIGNSNYGDFVLNNDSTKHYDIYYIGRYKTIIEDLVNSQGLLGGSAIPFFGTTISIEDSLVSIRFREIEGSLNGYNINYWTELTLKKIRYW